MNTNPFELKRTFTSKHLQRTLTNKPAFKFGKAGLFIFGKGMANLRELLLEAIKNRRIRLGSPGVFTRPADTFPGNTVYGYGKFLRKT